MAESPGARWAHSTRFRFHPPGLTPSILLRGLLTLPRSLLPWPFVPWPIGPVLLGLTGLDVSLGSSQVFLGELQGHWDG